MNKIVFGIEKYYRASNCDKEKARAEMWKDITVFLQMAFKNEYIVVVREDDADIIVIEFNYDNNIEYWGTETPYWLTEEECDLIEGYRHEQEKA